MPVFGRLCLALIAGLLYQGAFTVDDLDHMDIFGEDDEDIFGGHGEPALDFAFEAYKILFHLPDGFLQSFDIGNTDQLLAGQQYMDIGILDVAFPDGLLLGHGLVIEPVDENLVSVHFIAALDQLGQIGGLDMADSGIHGIADAEIPVQILALCINHKINTSLAEIDMGFDFLMISWSQKECNSWDIIENMSQYTKNMKIIFTMEQEINVDTIALIVYYVHKGKSATEIYITKQTKVKALVDLWQTALKRNSSAKAAEGIF